MSQPLVLNKGYNTPTIFNKEALIGALFLGPIGFVVGGIMGKSRINQENKQGKLVDEPTIFNKDMLVGLAFSSSVAALSLLAGGALLGPLGAVAGLAAGLVPPLVGGMIGKSAMQGEYEQAMAQTNAIGRSPARGYSQDLGAEPGVTIGKAQLAELERRAEQAHGQHR